MSRWRLDWLAVCAGTLALTSCLGAGGSVTQGSGGTAVTGSAAGSTSVGADSGLERCSETLGTRAEFREIIERRAVGIVMFDVGWVGGISEARKIAAMAETHHLPVAPHDANKVALTAFVAVLVLGMFVAPVTFAASFVAERQICRSGQKGAGLATAAKVIVVARMAIIFLNGKKHF